MDYNEAVGFEHVFVRCAMRLNRPVWVTLARIYPLNTGPRPRFHYAQLAIDLSEQEVPGVLHAWYRSTTGEWYGLVSFSIMYAARNPSTGLQLEDQLVPAHSLRPRSYGPDRRDRPYLPANA